MRRLAILVLLGTALVGIVSCADPSSEGSEQLPIEDLATKVQLPIEVLGPDGYTEEVTFTLTTAKGIDTLYLQTHRLAYRDASTNVQRGAKGSVRLNGGKWLDLSNATSGLECYAHEAAYGCLNGAYHTVRFTMPMTGAKAGKNKLEFRFNATDGFSSGYRVLAFNFRQGKTGQDKLAATAFTEDNPAAWKAPLNTRAAINAGKSLWETKVLKESPLSSTNLKATCSGCHAADGRDLKYFNYSNWAIETRSRFHGLSETEGKQIASYIRSLKTPAPKQARPWNPPYQPGPGLDSRPVEEWAAGAGLKAVLEKDSDMKAYLFPEGTSDAQLRKVMDKNSTLNMRELPIAMQFPDWNEWLPEVHPLDVLGEELFLKTPVEGGDSLYGSYVGLDKLLSSNSVAALIRDDELYAPLNSFTSESSNFPNTVFYEAEARGIDGEVFRPSEAHWGAVKQWELMQKYGLEDEAPALHGKYGEARSWLTMRRNVFEMAPHRAAENIVNFPYQSELVGKYFSTAWYQLQLTLNAGNRQGINLWPVDWNYQPDHIGDLYGSNGPAHPYRFLASHTKMYQQFADGDIMEDTALGFRQIHIKRVVPGVGKEEILDTLPEAVRINAYEALLNGAMDVLEFYKPGDWERGLDPTEFVDLTLEPANYVLTDKAIPLEELGEICHELDYANCWYSSIPFFKEIGVDTKTINRLVDWGEAMWPAPKNDWDALR
jgi:cytochrome c553